MAIKIYTFFIFFGIRYIRFQKDIMREYILLLLLNKGLEVNCIICQNELSENERVKRGT